MKSFCIQIENYLQQKNTKQKKKKHRNKNYTYLDSNKEILNIFIRFLFFWKFGRILL